MLHVWDIMKIPSVTFEYCTVEDSSKEAVVFKERFRKHCAQKIHCCYYCLIEPSSEKNVFSEANVFNTTQVVHLQDEECQVEDIRVF
jgi:hypothetical protein